MTKEKHRLRLIGMYGKKQSDKQRQTISRALKGKPKSPEHVAKQRESIIKTFSDPNYVHPNKGRKHTAEELLKMKGLTKNRPKKECPHCGVVMDERNYAKYHGDRCKKKA